MTSGKESAQIAILRILCIAFMMSAHVRPLGDAVASEAASGAASGAATGAVSWAAAGAIALIRTVWVNFLGHASVAALSFASGFLLVRAAGERGLAAFAGRRFVTLMVPLVTWNAIYLGLVALDDRMVHAGGQGGLATFLAAPVAALTGLTGETANYPLFFIRDLFVASALLRASLPLVARLPWLALAATLALAAFDATAPVLFRPSILLFATAGAVYALRGPGLARFAEIRFAAPAALALLAIFAALHAGRVASPPLAALEEFAKRGLLVVLFLGAAGSLAETACGGVLAALSTASLEVYLLHLPLFNAWWILWRAALGEPAGWTWVGQFLTAPLAAIAAGWLMARGLDRAPAAAQVALRGRVRGPASAARAPLSRRPAGDMSRDDIGREA